MVSLRIPPSHADLWIQNVAVGRASRVSGAGFRGAREHGMRETS